MSYFDISCVLDPDFDDDGVDVVLLVNDKCAMSGGWEVYRPEDYNAASRYMANVKKAKAKAAEAAKRTQQAEKARLEQQRLIVKNMQIAAGQRVALSEQESHYNDKAAQKARYLQDLLESQNRRRAELYGVRF